MAPLGLALLLLPPAAAAVTGMHVDEEYCSGNLDQPQGPNNRSTQVRLCTQFLDQLHNLSAQLKAQSPPLSLSVDAGTWSVCPPGSPPAPAPSSCFNLTYRGASKSIAEHIVDVADRAVLMDYDTKAQHALGRAAPFLRYADSIGKERSVVVGLAVAPPGAAPTWWQTKDELELQQLMAELRPALSRHRSFGGFSVFDSTTWAQSSAAHPAPPGTAFHPTGAWYADHAMVLNRTRRGTWLAWAKSRALDRLFIAAHASNTALIPVPGIEGSAAAAQEFCHFIQQAEAHGISIELL